MNPNQDDPQPPNDGTAAGVPQQPELVVGVQPQIIRPQQTQPSTEFTPNPPQAQQQNFPPAAATNYTPPPAQPVQTSYQTPTTLPPQNKPRSGKKRVLIAGFVAVLLLLIGVGAVFGWYLPNRPENVWSTGLERTGQTFNDLVIASTEQDKLNALKNSELTGSVEASSNGVTMSGTFSSKYSQNNSDNAIHVKMRGEGMPEQDLSLKLLTNIPEGKEFPNVYFQLSGIQNLGLDLFLPGISNYDGRWITISSDYLASLAPSDDPPKENKEALTHADAAELARTAANVTREYVFTANPDKSVLVLKDFVGTEALDGDITANRYTASIHKENAKQYCQALIESVTATEAYKRIPGVNPDDIDKDSKETVDNCKKDIDDDLSDDDTFDLWIDKKYKLVHKVRLTQKDKPGESVEIGQSYTGGDIIPVFFTYRSNEDKSDSKLTLEFNTKESTTKGDFNYTQDKDDGYKIDMDFALKPHDGEVKAEQPAGSIPLEEVIQQLQNPVIIQ